MLMADYLLKFSFSHWVESSYVLVALDKQPFSSVQCQTLSQKSLEKSLNGTHGDSKSVFKWKSFVAFVPHQTLKDFFVPDELFASPSLRNTDENSSAFSIGLKLNYVNYFSVGNTFVCWRFQLNLSCRLQMKYVKPINWHWHQRCNVLSRYDRDKENDSRVAGLTVGT